MNNLNNDINNILTDILENNKDIQIFIDKKDIIDIILILLESIYDNIDKILITDTINTEIDKYIIRGREISKIIKGNNSYIYINTMKIPPENIPIYKARLIQLLNRVIPDQRTPEWYEMRNNMVTASDILKTLKKSKNRDDLILKKCGYGEQSQLHGNAIMHGIKYEEIACKLYKYKNKVDVYSFGCLQHDEYSFIGASPDGITQDGIMLEIKCPLSRQITGIIPDAYAAQIQLQLEVCKLEYCDYLEVMILEYNDETDYINDTIDMEKGVIINVFDNTLNKTIYIYGEVGLTKQQIDNWLQDEIDKIIIDDNLTYLNTTWWHLSIYSCVRVKKNNWFSDNFNLIKQFWDDVLYHRKNGYQSLIREKKVKKYTNEIAENTCLINSDCEN